MRLVRPRVGRDEDPAEGYVDYGNGGGKRNVSPTGPPGRTDWPPWTHRLAAWGLLLLFLTTLARCAHDLLAGGEAEKIEHILTLNLDRRHLSREQRQELVAKPRCQVPLLVQDTNSGRLHSPWICAKLTQKVLLERQVAGIM